MVTRALSPSGADLLLAPSNLVIFHTMGATRLNGLQEADCAITEPGDLESEIHAQTMRLMIYRKYSQSITGSS